MRHSVSAVGMALGALAKIAIPSAVFGGMGLAFFGLIWSGELLTWLTIGQVFRVFVWVQLAMYGSFVLYSTLYRNED